MSKKMHISKETIGSEGEPIAIIDNFFPADEMLVKEGLNRPYVPEEGFYPGSRSVAPIQYINYLGNCLLHSEGNLGELFGYSKDGIASIHSAFSFVFKRPDELDILQKIPHYDTPKNNVLACVHYLVPQNSCFGGTNFFQHKSTGYEYITEERKSTYQTALDNDIEKFGIPTPPRYIDNDTDIFSKVASFDAVYNRAIFYRSTNLHSAHIKEDHDFNFNPKTGRLTVTSFVILKEE